MKLKMVAETLLERIAIAFNLAPAPLVETQIAFTSARAIMAAAELGIYEALGKESRTHGEVARACTTDPEATRHLLDCLAGIGYLAWSDGRYALKPRYRKWLLEEYESNLIGKLRFQLTEWNWMARLEDYVRTGQPMDMHAALSREEWAQYQDGMRDLSVNTARELAGKLKLPAGAATMLDIGGSHGLYSIELCRRHPGLRSTILELPGAVDRAGALAAAQGMGNRVDYRAGDALADDLGRERYDLILINNVVHHFTADQSLALARKAAAALKPGGIFAIGEFIRRQRPGDGGAVASAAGLYFSLTSASGTWSLEEMRSWQEKAGLKPLKPIRLLTLPGWESLPASAPR